MSRLYWFTIEFGLIKEHDKTEIYGAGILSSIGESVYSLESDVPVRKAFDIQAIFDSPYIKEKFQVEYYIIESFVQKKQSVDSIEAQLEVALAKAEKTA